MKKSILLINLALVSIGLMAIPFINWETSVPNTCSVPTTPFIDAESDNFYYAIGTRFEGIKKSQLNRMTMISEFISPGVAERIIEYDNNAIVIVKNDVRTETRSSGESKKLNENQIAFLAASSYSTNFVFEIDCTEKNLTTGLSQENQYTPHYTITPHKEAVYSKGNEAFISLIRAINAELTKDVSPDILMPAKLYFTIDKEGSMTNVYLDRSTGYPEIDANTLDFFQKNPAQWIPAENALGQKVEQELVLTMGMIGC